MKLDININDFICRRSNKDLEAQNIVSLSKLDEYILSRETIILHKKNKQNAAPVYLFIDEKLDLLAYLPIFSEYLNWLGGECKSNLIRYFLENTEDEAISGDEWYNELDIYRVLITIENDKILKAGISCVDYNEHILDIVIEGKDIVSISYYEDDMFDEENDCEEDLE